MQAYCVKCRAKKEMKDAKSITMKHGKPANYLSHHRLDFIQVPQGVS